MYNVIGGIQRGSMWFIQRISQIIQIIKVIQMELYKQHHGFP